MDVRIIFKTIKAVLSHEGIGQGEKTPESFQYTDNDSLKRRRENDNGRFERQKLPFLVLVSND